MLEAETSTAADIAALVRAAGAGDQRSWDQLVERYSGLVWTVARSHRLSEADASDVSQVTWLRLVEHLGSLREPERVGAWLATTARREALRVIRKTGRAEPVPPEVIDLRVDAEPELDHGMLKEEAGAELWQAFERLPGRCQLMLRLLMGEADLSYKELSNLLEMPIGSIGPTRARCLEHLRRILEGVAAPA